MTNLVRVSITLRSRRSVSLSSPLLVSALPPRSWTTPTICWASPSRSPSRWTANSAAIPGHPGSQSLAPWSSDMTPTTTLFTMGNLLEPLLLPSTRSVPSSWASQTFTATPSRSWTISSALRWAKLWESISSSMEACLKGSSCTGIKATTFDIFWYIYSLRDGVGEGQIPYIVNHEVAAIKRSLQKASGEGQELKFTYIIVSKRINTRYAFERNL